MSFRLPGCFVLLVVSCLLVSCRLGYGDDSASADAEPEVLRTYCEQLGHDWGFNYCRDFDDDEPFEFGWDTRVLEPGALVQSDNSAYSDPASFLAKVPAGEAEACVSAYSESKGVGASDAMRLTFQMRMGSMDSITPFRGAFMSLRATDTTGDQRCAFTIYGDGTAGGVLQSSLAPTTHPFTVRFPLEYEWTEVRLDVDYETKTFDVSLNGSTAFSARQPLAADCDFDGNFVVSPGIHCDEALPVASGEVRLDDIHMSYNPVPN